MENRTPADQHPALQLLALRPELLIRQGHVAATWRHRNGKTYGPYYRLAYREGGRQRSIYLGRDGELVQRVRSRLAALQRPRVETRALRRLERHIRAVLNADRRKLNALLRPYGLHMKGYEVRGWRIRSGRGYLPRRRRFLSSVRVRPKQPFIYPHPQSPRARLERFMAARDKTKNDDAPQRATTY